MILSSSCVEKIDTPKFDYSLLEGYWKGWNYEVDAENHTEESVNMYVYFDGGGYYEELYKNIEHAPVFRQIGYNYKLTDDVITIWGVFELQITELTSEKLTFVQPGDYSFTFRRTTKAEYDQRVKELEDYRKELEESKQPKDR